MGDFIAKVRSVLDTSDITTKLKSVENASYVLRNVTFDSTSLINAIQSALNKTNLNISFNQSNIVNQMQQTGTNAGRTFSSALSSQINPNVLVPVQSAIDKLVTTLNGQGLSSNAISNIISGITSNAQKAEIQITKVDTSFRNFGKNAGNISKVITSGFDKSGNAVTIIDTFNRLNGQLISSETRIREFFNSVSNESQKTQQALENSLNINLSNGKFQADLQKIELQINNLNNVTDPLKQNLAELKTAFDTMNDPSRSMSERVDAMRTYQSLIPGVRAQISQLAAVEANAAAEAKAARDAISLQDSRESFFRKVQNEIQALTPTTESFRAELISIQNQIATADGAQLSHLKAEYDSVVDSIRNEEQAVKDAAAAQLTLTNSSTLSNNIQTWMNNNKKAAEQFGNELRNLQKQLENNINPGTLKDVGARFREIQSEAKAAGVTTNSFATSLKNTVLQLAGLSSGVMIFRKVISTIKEACSTVIELDTSLIDLQKTSTASARQLEDFYLDANEAAKEYGTTTKEIIQSAADWSRLGYSLEDSELMSKYSSMFKSISPGMDIDTATTSLVSVMKAYGIEANDVLDGVMSKINKIGNTAATSNEEIATGLRLSSAAMATMGGTLEENIALFTAAQEIMQSDTKVGNGLRTNFVRMYRNVHIVHI